MIGNRIRQRRLQLGLTQLQLAEMIGSKKNTISNYECNISSPSEDVILSLMEALKCDANYLYGDFFPSDNELPLDKNEEKIIKSYRKFNDEGKEKLIDIMSDMEQLPRYTRGEDDNGDIMVYRAARSADNHPAEITTLTKEEQERIEKAPRVTSENSDL